jgi:hypothetical protein
MAWTPRYHHVSQLHAGPDGSLSGWNDCWEACLARYLRERDPQVCGRDDWALLDAVSLAARGRHDAQDNAETTLDEAARSLRFYGIEARWTVGYQEALQAPWAICLVDGTALAPAQYPANWFDASAPGPNHFVLWLPFWQDSAAWFNDPLAYANGRQDCLYDLVSVVAAFSGAYLLPSTGHGEDVPAHLEVAARCALKVQPNHTCTALADLPAGTVVIVQAGTQGEWQRVRLANGMSGWVPRGRLRAVA